MAALLDLSFKKETLETILSALNIKEQDYFNLTVSVNDENRYDQNVSAYASQSKEQREAKKPRFYIGNGRVLWTDGKVKTWKQIKEGETPTPEPSSNGTPETDDLPF